MQKDSQKPANLLVVEDNSGDARLIKELFYESKVFNSLHFVHDGVEALDFVFARGRYKNIEKPDLIILDLNLPKKDGREVLAEIKSNNDVKHIPVVIMTISQAEEDVMNSYNLHANCYVTKPIDLTEFIKVIRSIENFWFSTVQLPSK